MKRPAQNHPARVYAWFQIDGRKHWALFDSGPVRTYVADPAAQALPRKRLPQPVRRGLAGRTFTISEACWLVGTVEQYTIDASALVVDRLLDDERGRPVEILVGMETMQAWGIELDIRRKRLDFTHYQKEAYEG